MTAPGATAAARERLRARQSHVLSEVVAGRVPEGFDQRTTTVTGRVLRAKRRRAAVHAAPFLAAVADLPDRFDEFAVAHPPAGCAHEDADAFAAWADAQGLLDGAAPQAGEGWRVRQVELGLRRVAVVGRGRRRRVVVGVGRWVYDIGRGRSPWVV